jgi:hypothetical protein
VKLLSVLPLLLVACSGDGPPKGDDPFDGGSNATVNGQPASEYYQQFTWEEIETYVVGAGSMSTQSDGRNLVLVHLYLMEDGSFTLFYEEGEGESDLTGWSISTYTETQRREEGSYALQDGQLRVGDLLSCTGMSFNGEEVLSCQLEQEIGSGDAVDSSFTLSPDVFGASHPDDSEWGDYE